MASAKWDNLCSLPFQDKKQVAFRHKKKGIIFWLSLAAGEVFHSVSYGHKHSISSKSSPDWQESATQCDSSARLTRNSSLCYFPPDHLLSAPVFLHPWCHMATHFHSHLQQTSLHLQLQCPQYIWFCLPWHISSDFVRIHAYSTYHFVLWNWIADFITFALNSISCLVNVSPTKCITTFILLTVQHFAMKSKRNK